MAGITPETVNDKLIGQHHECWMGDCTNGGWFTPGSNERNSCMQAVNCIQTQVTNRHRTLGGGVRRTKTKGEVKIVISILVQPP